MGIFTEYPYVNYNDLNLDSILKNIDVLKNEMKDFKAVNSLKNYGEWVFSKTYPIYSLVTNEDTLYISLKDVPAGTYLTNEEFWTPAGSASGGVRELEERVDAIENEISTEVTPSIESAQTTATGAVQLANGAQSTADNALNRASSVYSDGYKRKVVKVSGVGVPEGQTNYDLTALIPDLQQIVGVSVAIRGEGTKNNVQLPIINFNTGLAQVYVQTEAAPITGQKVTIRNREGGAWGTNYSLYFDVLYS